MPDLPLCHLRLRASPGMAGLAPSARCAWRTTKSARPCVESAPPASRQLQILAVTPRPQAMMSLKSIPGISVDVLSPGEYEKSERTAYGLEIFHFSAPAVPPQNPALFILPPESHSLAKPGTPISDAVVSGWREPHTLTRYINFSLFRPTYARPLKPQSAGDVVIESPNGALAFATERQGVRYLTLGFDPLPFLGRENLPMSIFTLNLIDWFFESGGSSGQGTGEPIRLGSIEKGDRVVTPAGEKISLKRELVNFSATFYQGIYQLERGGRVEAYARNLQDPGESDLRNPVTIEIQRGPSPQRSGSVLFSFWPYLLLASVALLLIEWFINKFSPGKPLRVSPEDMNRLRRHSWPGNVRELRNTIERACLLARGEYINLDDALHEEPTPSLGIRTDLPFKEAKGQLVEMFEREYIEDLMRRHRMNLSAAAREAQIDRKHLRELIRKYDLDPRGKATEPEE